MKRTRLAIVGLGKLGRACAELVAADAGSALAGVVRRPESAPATWLKAPAVTHISELSAVDAALVCVPADEVPGVAQALLQSRIPVVECARLHGAAFLAHKAEIHRAALRHKVPAVVGAGCDPGVLSLLRSLLALLVPHGHTETRLHGGGSLHHTLAAAGVKGVREALATERTAPGGALQRYVYVELEPSADAAAVERAIVSDPLFLDAETRVFPVESVAALEAPRSGVTLARSARGRSRPRGLPAGSALRRGRAGRAHDACRSACRSDPAARRLLPARPAARRAVGRIAPRRREGVDLSNVCS